jgi:hypothetical protein
MSHEWAVFRRRPLKDPNSSESMCYIRKTTASRLKERPSLSAAASARLPRFRFDAGSALTPTDAAARLLATMSIALPGQG